MPNETLTKRSLGGLTVTKVEERSPWLNMGITGESGVGKTVLAGSASAVEEMSPVINIDLENGSESLRRTYPNVEVVRVKNIKELQDVYNDLYHGDHPYRTVMLDSSTELQTFDMMGIMGDKVALNPEADPDLPEWQQYGKSLVRMRALIRGFRDLEMHTIITSLSMDLKDKKTGLTTVTPKFTGQFAKEYPALLDVILYYYTRDVLDSEGNTVNGRFLLSSKTEKVVAKDRTNTLPIVLPEPTMAKIYDFMKNAPVIQSDNYQTGTEEPVIDESELPKGVDESGPEENSNLEIAI